MALAVGASMVFPALLPWAVGVAALFWALRWLVTRRPTRRSPADLSILLLVLLIPVTLWATALPEITRPQVYRLLTGIALFYTILNWTDTPRRLQLLAGGTILAGLLLALSAPFTVEWAVTKLPFAGPLYDRFIILVADTANPNVMAANIVILLPLAFSLPLFHWGDLGRPLRILAVVSALAMAGVMVLTLARGGILAMAVALLLLAVLRWPRAWWLVALAVLAGGITLQVVGSGQAADFLSTGGVVGSLESRLEIWSRAVYMVQDFPFTGIGMGSFTQVTDLLYPLFLAPPGRVPHAHNLFLQIAVDLGIPGLVAWLSIWGIALACAWNTYRQGKRLAPAAWLPGIGAGMLCSQVALGLHGLFEAVTWGLVRPAPLVWALWGLTLASWQLLNSPAEGTS